MKNPLRTRLDEAGQRTMRLLYKSEEEYFSSGHRALDMLPPGAGLQLIGSDVGISRAAKKHPKNHLLVLMSFS